jgi:hypothetical protein
MKKLIPIILIAVFLAFPVLAVEDFTTYTEVDPNSRISKTATRTTFTALTRDEDAYVYYDYTANHFAGDFEHLLTISSDTTSGDLGDAGLWQMTNALDDRGGLYSANEPTLFVSAYFGVLQLHEYDSPAADYQSANYSITANTPYYLKIKRDESVGTYGTIYCYVYTDAARTTLVATLSVALHTSKKDYRYVGVSWSADYNNAANITGYSENLDLQEASAVVVEPDHPIIIISE